MRPRVNATKHIVQVSLANVAAGAISQFSIVDALQVPTLTAADEVREGAIVSACYIELWVTSGDAAQASTIITLEKLIGSSAAMTAAEIAALNAYDNKKNVLNIFMGLVAPNVQVATPAIRGWYKIPKGKQRFGIGDRLVLNVMGQSNDVNVCGFFLFKEQQ